MLIMISFLKLIRWKNLLLIALSQFLVKYALIEPFGLVDFTLNNFTFGLLLTATLLIAAAGNIINDLFDIETDVINKPTRVIIGKKISEKLAFIMYIAFTSIGVILGFYVSNLINQNALSAMFVIVSVLLYLYAIQLKRTILIGNIVVSILVAFSLLIIGLFELLPAITSQNQATQLTFFYIIIDYALFAFLINLLREIIKDIQDINGDCKAKMTTLPIAIGIDRTLKIVFFISCLPIMALIYYIVIYLYNYSLAVGYFLLFLLGPLLYFSLKLLKPVTNKDLVFLSSLLKIIMFFGVLSLLLYPFIIKP